MKADTGDNGHSATGTTDTKQYHAPTLMRESGESVAGTKWKTLSRRWYARRTRLTALGRFGRLGANAERLSILERMKRSSIELISDSRYLAYGRLS